MSRRRTAPIVVVCCVAAAAGACTRRDDAAPPPRSALRQISLPDLSQMAPSAQAQVRNRHAALMQRMAAPGTSDADLADAYGELGRILMAADHRDAAEPCFLDAEALAPHDFRWPYLLGHVYRQNGDVARAIASLERARHLQPGDVAVLVWLGNLQLDAGHPEQAKARFANALSLEPTSLSARFGLGRAALAEQDYAGAVAELEDVLRRDPKASAAHYPLAMAYRALGEAAKAEAHLALRDTRQILPADPLIVDLEGLLESPQSYETRGIQALDRNDWAGAAALFRKGLELAPDHAALRHRLGTALYMMGDSRAAREQFEQAVRAAPDNFLAQYSLGVLLQSDGRHADAIDHFAAALKARAGYTEARLRLANSLRRVGRAADAVGEYRTVLSSAPDNAEARFNYAVALVQLRRDRDARAVLSEAVSAYPAQSLFAHALARLLASAPDAAVRDGERSIALVQDLLKKEPRTLELGETMAMALAAAGRYDEAAAVQRDLLKGARENGLGNTVPRLAKNLARYERGEPCRTPWADDEVP